MSKKKDKPGKPKPKPKTFNPPFALSGSWNIRRSSVKAIDLANTQQAIQGFMDILMPEEKYRVVWKGQANVPGMTDFDEQTIQLSYAPLSKTKGMTPDKLVDVVMGVGVHEVGHTGFRALRKECGANIQDVDPQVLGVLEDIHIDYGTVKDQPVVGAYIRRGRDYDNEVGDFPGMIRGRLEIGVPLQVKDLMGMWQGVMLYGIDVLPMLQDRSFPDSEIAQEALRRLLKIGVEAISNLGTPKNYARLALQAQGAIEEFVEEMKELANQAGTEQQIADLAALDKVVQNFQDGAYGDDDQDSQGELEGDQPRPGKGGHKEEESGDDGNVKGKAGKNENTEEEAEDQESEGGEGQGEEDQAGSDGGGEKEEGEEADSEESEGAGGSSSSSPQGSNDGGGSSSGSQQDVGEFDLGKMSSCMSAYDGKGADKSEMPMMLAEAVFEASEHQQEEIGEKYGIGQYIKEIPKAGGMDTQYAELGNEVRMAFDTRQHMATVRYPFQESGRVSKRTLPRLFLGKTDLFEEVTQEDDLDMVLVLLFDMSGSMTPEQIAICKAAISATIEGFKDDDSTDLWVWGYGRRLYRMYEPGWPEARFGGSGGSGGLPTGSSTPSLPAIKEVVKCVGKSPSVQRKDKVMIHFTDGMANAGGEPRSVGTEVARLEENGWVIIGAGVTGSYADAEKVSSYMAKAYKPEHRFVIEGGFRDLPDHLREVIAKL